MTEIPDRYQRREFVRVAVELAVRYKFLSASDAPADTRVFEGMTRNVSAGGMLLRGPLPSRDWIADLLLHRIVIGFNLTLPGDSTPLKALARVTWVEALTESNTCAMGLNFKEISRDCQDRMVQFIIRSQMP